MNNLKIRTIILLLLLFIMCGCSGTAYNYVPEAGEMQAGSGLFSGEDGFFTIYEIEKPEESED